MSTTITANGNHTAPEMPAAAPPTILEHNPRLSPFWKAFIAILAAVGIGGTINQVFYLNAFGLAIQTNAFLYLMAACFVPIVFITTPISKKAISNRGGVPLYDVALALLFIGVSVWFASRAEDITLFGWSMVAPTYATVMSYVYWALVLEALRRAAGIIVAGLAFLVSIYPLFAGEIPIGVLQGISYDMNTLAQQHAMGSESILGLPLQTAGTILVGFLAFGVVLQHTGGAAFFNDLAMSIFGRYRGGTAKVSVASSASMGMMSGSAVSNVLTTGPMTIPAMIKNGFSARTAGAVEATASSGGSITPPIMGAAAFLMVSFAGVPYTQIIIAATIPAFLYFFGIFMQIDGYAALKGLAGTPRSELPRFLRTLISGWPYIFAFALLTVLLLTTPSEAQVPFWVVLALLIIGIITPKHKFGIREIYDVLVDLGISLGKLFATIAGVGLILGGLTATGVALSISRDLIAAVGENVILILITGAIACFVLGMGLTISAAYVFLAIVMVPALIALDVNVFAAHLFIIYWASVSYITPPVGLAAFAAAGISKDSPMGTSVEAMRLGAVKYIVPFGFALNPALVAQSSLPEVLLAGGLSVIAVFALAASFSGWIQFVEVKAGIISRVLLAVGGFMVFLPQYSITFTGIGIVVAVMAFERLRNSRKTHHPSREESTTDAPDTAAQHV
ncbi:MAG: TRAP transporter permease [Corynebacterium sp.]|uniref:TRAP transporter permease n=1 Tax=Corynebacterium sp. TaxID=1720 RepID=UPI0026E0C62F|nr:TRAP transporter permease [Corynebacterium sp.]MDO5670156.1 TRAP transporter permease [Corynebacterium sp.]